MVSVYLRRKLQPLSRPHWRSLSSQSCMHAVVQVDCRDTPHALELLQVTTSASQAAKGSQRQSGCGHRGQRAAGDRGEGAERERERGRVSEGRGSGGGARGQEWLGAGGGAGRTVHGFSSTQPGRPCKLSARQPAGRPAGRRQRCDALASLLHRVVHRSQTAPQT